MSQLKYDKNYIIRYAKSGIYQYANFMEFEGKIVNKWFHPTWVNINEIPSLDNANTIDEILTIIKEFTGNRAEIYKINGMLVDYYNNKQVQIDTDAHIATVEKVIENECIKFFQTHVQPILIKNNWFISYSWCGKPVIIYKDENGEWDNIKEDNTLIEYMCYRLINGLGLYDEKVNFESEHSKPTLNGFSALLTHIPHEQIESTGLYVKIE
jgi:hypothetical protein